jgi:hypothetical protein
LLSGSELGHASYRVGLFHFLASSAPVAYTPAVTFMRLLTHSAFLGLMLLCAAIAIAQRNSYAPLPDKVIKAKTVFLVNASGTTKFGDALYRQVTGTAGRS